MVSAPDFITAACHAGSFWLNVGTPHADPVTGLAEAGGGAEAWIGLGDGKPCGTDGIRTTRLSDVQQIDAEWPFVKLSATRSVCSATVAGCVEVSATQSWKP